MSNLSLITQGAEGRVFSADWLGRKVIIKHRFKKRYRHPDLDADITKERIKAEARSLIRCKMIGINVPTLFDVNTYSNEIIIENISNSVSVRNFIQGKNNNFASLQPLATEIGQILAKLHNHHIIHGDLTTSNMLVLNSSDKPVLYLIDFGLSFVSEQTEDKAVDLYVLERAVLSTHPNSENFMKDILDAYGSGKNEVLLRLDDVRTRGRKKLCFG